MARPRTIDDDALLESLRATFLDLGPAASTAELARRAGVSEGTLFKRFGTKKKLFSASMQLPSIEDEPWWDTMFDHVGRGSLEERLATLAGDLGRHLDDLLPRIYTIFAHGKLTPKDVADLAGRDRPDVVKRVAELLRREMREGRLRDGDADMLAHMFVGAVVHQAHLGLFFPDRVEDTPDAFPKRLARSFFSLGAA